MKKWEWKNEMKKNKNERIIGDEKGMMKTGWKMRQKVIKIMRRRQLGGENEGTNRPNEKQNP